MRIRRFGRTAWLAVVPAALAACGADAPTRSTITDEVTLSADARKPGEPGSASGRMLFQARLAPLGDSRAVGVLLLEVVGGHLTAKLHATGLDPLQHIPQHIHVNPTCDPGGTILVNLDATLAVAGEAPGVGAAYPVANQAGVVRYEASRSLESLRAAVNTHFGVTLATTEELLAWLDLDHRNAHMHVAFGPPFPAVNCGEIERLN